MQVELAQLLRDVPRQVRCDAVVEREKMDERRGCIDVLFINIIGVNLGSVQWCPNDNPPSLDETLAWIWFIRPDLRESIARSAPPNLQSLMDHYAREDLAGWYRLLRADDGRLRMTDAHQLLEAIRAGDLAAVDALVAAGVDVNATDAPHWPPLFSAIEHQRAEIVRRLIAAGADVHGDIGDGWTPLVHAIDIESDAAWQAHYEVGHESNELIALLLAAGAIPTDKAFELARKYNNQRAISLLAQARGTAAEHRR